MLRTRRGDGVSATVGEQQRAGKRSAAGAGHADLRVPRHLTLPRLAPQLHTRLVEEAVAVQPTGGELTDVRVQREHTNVAGDVLPTLDKRAALAVAAEAHRLQPRHRDDREAVVHLREVDVGG